MLQEYGIMFLTHLRSEGVSKCMPSFFYDKASTFPSRGFVMS